MLVSDHMSFKSLLITSICIRRKLSKRRQLSQETYWGRFSKVFTSLHTDIDLKVDLECYIDNYESLMKTEGACICFFSSNLCSR